MMRLWMMLILVLAAAVLAACTTNGAAETAVSAAPADNEMDAAETPAAMPTETMDDAPMQEADGQGVLSDLPDLGEAPEITNEVWVNADEPVTLASQRGKVVLVEFWTFGCINCRHVIPYVRDWYDKYNGDDFTVISVHYPEFAYEREYDNVVQATVDLDVRYPVAIDNDRVTWSAYHQRYWPTTYLIDKNGRIRYKQIGEGAYAQTEAAIVALMAEPEP